MQLLQLIAILCSALACAGSACLTIAAQVGAWAFAGTCERVLQALTPVAMLGATSGIALGLLGHETNWMVGGITLSLIGPLNWPTLLPSFDASYHEQCATPQTLSAARQALCAATAALSLVLFAAA